MTTTTTAARLRRIGVALVATWTGQLFLTIVIGSAVGAFLQYVVEAPSLIIYASGVPVGFAMGWLSVEGARRLRATTEGK